MDDALMREALSRYELPGKQTVLIRWNENMTYRVDEKYLLRIHKPREGFSTDLLQNGLAPLSFRQSEMGFIGGLRKGGMPLQTPVLNKDGRAVTVLGDGTPVTVLTWLPGRTVELKTLSCQSAGLIGQMIGQLHAASAALPADASAPRYDQALCARMADRLCRAGDTGAMETRFVKTMAEALDTIGTFLFTAEKAGQFIRVHGDLTPGNILMTDQGAVPIDFSLSGFCHPAMDVSGVMCDMQDERLRDAVKAGYQDMTGAYFSQKTLNLFRAFMVLLFIVCQYPRFSGEEWFSNALERWRRELFLPILQ